MPLLENLENRGNGFVSFIAGMNTAKAEWEPPRVGPNGGEHSQLVRRLTMQQRKTKRRGQGGVQHDSQPAPIPHYAQPHLAGMLPEYVNAGAERAAAVWGMQARTSADALQVRYRYRYRQL
jgi:hypothetical protein